MKILKIVGIAVAALVAIVVILGMILPKTYTVARSTTINAGKQQVMAQVAYFKNFDKWSPWNDYDSTIQKSYDGIDGQVGAKYSWKGNDQVGVGSQELIALTDSRADLKLVFTEPWQSTSTVYFQADAADNNATKITWGMQGQIPFPMNVMCLFMPSMDSMIGKDFDKGLAKLKTICESNPLYNGYEVKSVDLDTKTYIGKKSTVSFADMSAYFMKTMPETYTAVAKAGIQLTGAPCGLYFTWDTVAQKTDMAIAMPVAPGTKAPKGLEVITLPAAQGSIMVAYMGDYMGSMKAHQGLGMYMAQKQLQMNGPAVEEYVTDPMQEKDTTKWLTNIYYYVKGNIAQ
ncbi:MAG: SRPBCC family protein [Cytophagales bacterium]|nr:SRPBCC family protein [Cytophagales bacterium]